jgi:hypothetical protein
MPIKLPLYIVTTWIEQTDGTKEKPRKLRGGETVKGVFKITEYNANFKRWVYSAIYIPVKKESEYETRSFKEWDYNSPSRRFSEEEIKKAKKPTDRQMKQIKKVLKL